MTEFKGPRASCPICKKELTKTYVDDHLRSVHHVRGGLQGRTRRTPQEVKEGRSAATLQRLNDVLARRGVTDYHRPDEGTGITAGPNMPMVQVSKAPVQPVAKAEVRVITQPKPITRVANMEVVTDGERIGIVEWQET